MRARTVPPSHKSGFLHHCVVDVDPTTSLCKGGAMCVACARNSFVSGMSARIRTDWNLELSFFTLNSYMDTQNEMSLRIVIYLDSLSYR